MESLAPVRHDLITSGIPVPVGMRQQRNKSPDLPVKRSNTELSESTDSGQKRRIFHRRTYSHDASAALPTGHKTKSKHECTDVYNVVKMLYEEILAQQWVYVVEVHLSTPRCPVDGTTSSF